MSLFHVLSLLLLGVLLLTHQVDGRLAGRNLSASGEAVSVSGEQNDSPNRALQSCTTVQRVVNGRIVKSQSCIDIGTPEEVRQGTDVLANIEGRDPDTVHAEQLMELGRQGGCIHNGIVYDGTGRFQLLAGGVWVHVPDPC